MNNNNPFDNHDVASYTAETFGKSVRKRREQLRLSIREVAKNIGMSPVYLSDIERGNRPAPSGIFSKIDYMSALEEQLDLTESQKEVFRSMALVSSIENSQGYFLRVYFESNPSAYRFIKKAIVAGLSDEQWEELYNSIM